MLDDLSTGLLANLADVKVHFVEGTIMDPATLSKTFEDAGSVVHLAARPSVPRSLQDPMLSNEVNVTGTLRVLEAARRVNAHVVVASSSSVYGANLELPKREGATPMPVSPYAVSKLAAESYALAYQRCFGLATLAFRFFNVYGPLQPADHAYAAVIPRFVSAALRGVPLEIHGDGQQTRDFTYVGTVVRVLVEAIQRRVVHDGPVNLAFGSRVSLLRLVEGIQAVAGQPMRVEHRQTRPGDVRDSQADTVLLRSLFPSVVPVGLEEGLSRTVAWFRSGAGGTMARV